MQIYADNAATTKMSDTVINAMIPYMNDVFGNPSSIHSVGQRASEALVCAREKVAESLGCSAKEITFTSSGSESDNQALISAAKIGRKSSKNHIISTNIEHHAVLKTLEKLKAEGFEITLLPVSDKGLISPEQVENAITDKTCLVSVMYANNEIGTIQPISEIGRICREKNVIFHTDAVQAVGHVPINVREQNIDMLSLSAHKFHGPKGIGVLYSKKGIELESIILGGAQERGKRAGTENIPSIVGLATALDEAVNALPKSIEYVTNMRNKLIDGILKIEGSILNGDREKRLPSNANFSFEGIKDESLLLLLDAKEVCASGASACASGSLNPSHVLLAIGRTKAAAQGALRLSLAEDVTEEEVNYIIKSVKESVNHLREISPL